MQKAIRKQPKKITATPFTQEQCDLLADRFAGLLSEFKYDPMMKSAESEITLKYVISRFGDLLKENNPNFNEELFVKAIESRVKQ